MAPQSDTVWTPANLTSASAVQMTTQAWAIANQLSSVSNRLEQDKQHAIAAYNAAFDEYTKNRNDRPDAKFVEPIPACIEQIVFDANGFPELAPGTVEVCARRVYQLPANLRPSLSTASGGLMGALVAEGAGKPGDPTIPTVAQFEKSTDSAGHLWMRLS